MSSVRQRQLKFGAILAGVGTDFSQWRDPELPPNASIDIDWYIHNARLAEEARFDLVFIVDSPFITPDTAPHFLNRLEPLTLLSALAVSTSRIGLVGTLTTTYWEPYNVARLFGSLDHISKGRAGWNVVTTGLEGASRNYGKDKHLDHALRYQRAEEFVDVVKGLWDSYEDDAFPYDRENDVFLDKSKQHALNHKGEFLSVAGPLALSRSPQGYPVIFQAGDSNAGRQLGAQIADGTFAAVEDFESAQEYYHDLKTRAKALGRDPDSIHVLPGIAPIIAETDEEAREIAVEREGGLEIAVEREGGLDIDKSLSLWDVLSITMIFGSTPLDAPFPDISNLTLNSYKGHAERILRGVNAGKLTLRQAAERYGSWRLSFVGSPETVANEIERWFVGNAADGFNIRVTSPRDFKLFRERVIPILQERGLFRTEYEGTTLRDHLGLSVPENRWTARKREESSRADAA